MVFDNNRSKGSFNRGPKKDFNRGPNKGGFNKRGPRRDNRPQREEKVWVPKTLLGKAVLAGKYPTLSDMIISGRNKRAHLTAKNRLGQHPASKPLQLFC